MSADSEYSTLDLRQMDRETAERELTKLQFDRWEKLHELKAGAEETRERFAQEDELVTDLTVTADMADLGTEVDLYGDTALVHLDSDNEQFIDAAESLDAEFPDADKSDVPEMDDEDREVIASRAMEMLDAMLVRWNGTEWASVPEHEQQALLETLRQEWGIDALFLSIFKCADAIQEDREEQVEAIESFRGEKRRGRR